MKTCKACGLTKDVSEFPQHVHSVKKTVWINGRCRLCYVEHYKALSTAYFAAHRAEIALKKPERDHRYMWQLRQRVFAQYGNECVCCQERCIYFLQMTHPDGWKAPHTSEKIRGHGVYYYLQRHHYPATYRILCGNCHRATASFSFCPHRGIDMREMSTGRAYRWQLRCDILAAYGGICGCCGETNPYFLEIDHPLGDGGPHRRSIGGRVGASFYRYLRDEGFPSSYRLLCSNCNTCRGWFGFCPHEQPVPEQWWTMTREYESPGRPKELSYGTDTPRPSAGTDAGARRHAAA